MGHASYTLGRICAVGMRPACLFVANNYFPPDTARTMAVAFLASSLALMSTAADPHRRFYARQFDHERASAGFHFYLYVMALMLTTVLGVAIVFGIAIRSLGSWGGAAVAAAYFLSERLADELLRLRFFERDFAGWGRVTIVRTALQAGGLLLLALAGSLTGWAVVMVMAAANAIVFVPGLPRSLVRVAAPRRVALAVWLVRRAGAMILRDWRVWAIAVLGAAVGYLDRIVALLVDPALLPIFLLVVMSFSIVPMGVDFYYISRHRRDFLQQRLTLRDVLSSREFAVSLVSSTVLAALACFLVLTLSRNGSAFPLEYVALIAIVQTTAAVAVIPQQLLYWHQEFRRILSTEMSFWIAFAAAAFIVWWFSLSLPILLALVTVCGLGRLAAYAARAVRVPVASRSATIPVPHEVV